MSTNILTYAPSDLLGLDYIAGIDEVGRGCAAGPVVAAAVILPKDFYHPLIKDSKKLSDKKKYEAYSIILENAIAYSVQATPAKLINVHGINQSTFMAMHKSLDELGMAPQHLLVDGIVWSDYKEIPYTCVPKGDNTYLSIAAASIIAKVRRDEYMTKLSEIHPEYDFHNNKGYLTAKHGEGILAFGNTIYHREQFVNTWLKNR